MASGKVLAMRPNTKPQKTTQTVVDTIMFTRAEAEAWRLPPFQRPLRVNEKVRVLAAQIKETGVVPGVLTFGSLDRQEYLIDGQHRRQAFILADIELGFADIRRHYFDDLGEMAEEFVNLNSRLVVMRPDDILRGLESSIEPLARIREKCKFVGYDNIRRGTESPIMSMSLLLRAWSESASETPSSRAKGAAALATELTMEDADRIVQFLSVAHGAWGRDPEYARLWSGLNLVLCLWLWRRLILAPEPAKFRKRTEFSVELFGKCMMSLSADATYIDWLRGRRLGETDRTPAFRRIKEIFAKRVLSETKAKAILPQPEWA